MDRKTLLTSISFLIVFCLALSPVSADKLTLHNGKSIEGLIEKEDGNEIVLRVEDGTVTFSRGEIASIEKGPWEPPKKEIADTAQDIRQNLANKIKDWWESTWLRNKLRFGKKDSGTAALGDKYFQEAQAYFSKIQAGNPYFGRGMSATEVARAKARYAELVRQNGSRALRSAQASLKYFLQAGEDQKAKEARRLIKSIKSRLNSIADEKKSNIESKNVVVGMTKDDVKRCWGRPSALGSTDTRWYYKDSMGNNDKYVYFTEDGIVTEVHEGGSCTRTCNRW